MRVLPAAALLFAVTQVISWQIATHVPQPIGAGIAPLSSVPAIIAALLLATVAVGLWQQERVPKARRLLALVALWLMIEYLLWVPILLHGYGPASNGDYRLIHGSWALSQTLAPLRALLAAYAFVGSANAPSWTGRFMMIWAWASVALAAFEGASAYVETATVYAFTRGAHFALDALFVVLVASFGIALLVRRPAAATTGV